MLERRVADEFAIEAALHGELAVGSFLGGELVGGSVSTIAEGGGLHGDVGSFWTSDGHFPVGTACLDTSKLKFKND